MKYQFSAANWCFRRPDVPLDDYYAGLAEAGCDAVEMAPLADLPAIRRAGLTLLNQSGPGMVEGMNNPANRERLSPELRRAIEQAADAGVPQVIVFSGNRFGESDAQGYENCRAGYSELLPFAERHGVTLVLEMLNPFDHPGYQADHSAFGFRLAREFNSPYFKVLYDVYHMFRQQQDILADFAANMELIAHLHLAGAPRRDFPGPEQEIPYPEIIAAARRAGYTGYLGMEFVCAQEPLRQLKESVALFRNY